jgi:hypothetical protein
MEPLFLLQIFSWVANKIGGKQEASRIPSSSSGSSRECTWELSLTCYHQVVLLSRVSVLDSRGRSKTITFGFWSCLLLCVICAVKLKLWSYLRFLAKIRSYFADKLSICFSNRRLSDLLLCDVHKNRFQICFLEGASISYVGHPSVSLHIYQHFYSEFSCTQFVFRTSDLLSK